MASVIPLQALLFHEVWICLQHGNVLLNPLCQRLDRNYGISLFKNDMVWVIAFTLSAYWLREIISMTLCYNLATPFTQKLILISCGYHAFKIVNVNIDAWRKWSPKLGILRLLLDYWHFDTIVNCIISFKRMFLQGFDTVVHGCIIFDIVNSSDNIPFPDQINISEGISPVPFARAIVIFAGFIWLFHAVVVQISRKSTATLMVEMYRNVAIFLGLIDHKRESLIHLPTMKESTNRHTLDKMKGNSLDLFLGPHIYTSHKSSSDCKVCRMLSKPTIIINNINTQNSLHIEKSESPSVVFLAHPVQLASAFSLWSDKGKGEDSYWRASWWMETPIISFLVFLISIVIYPIGVIWFNCSPIVVVDKSSILFKSKNNDTNNNKINENTLNLDNDIKSSISPNSLQPPTKILTQDHLQSELVESNINSEVWFAKSFGWQYASPSTWWRGYAKEMVVRSVLKAEKLGVKVIGLGALNKAHWLNNGGEDVVKEIGKRRKFLSTAKNILSPNDVTSLLEFGLCGECSSNEIKVVHGNTLTAAVVCDNLKSILLNSIKNNEKNQKNQMDKNKECKYDGNLFVPLMSIILIGATSKIGRAIALTMSSADFVSIICVGTRSKRMEQILKECSSIILKSFGKGYEKKILYCASALEANEVAPNAVWLLGKGDRSNELIDIIPFRARVLSFAIPCPLADLNGKSFTDSVKENFKNFMKYLNGHDKEKKEIVEKNKDNKENNNNINDNNNNHNDDNNNRIQCDRILLRKDVRYIDAGVMVIPQDMKEKRQFTLLLPRRLVYTCHAATLIHYLEAWNYHEVGEVILENMEITLTAAQKHGFSVNSLPKSFLDNNNDNDNCHNRDDHQNEQVQVDFKRNINNDLYAEESADVVVIGCGPSGLAVAGSLLLNSGNDQINNSNDTNYKLHDNDNNEKNDEKNDNKNHNKNNKLNVMKNDQISKEMTEGINREVDKSLEIKGLGKAAAAITVRMIDIHNDIEGQWLSQYQGLSLTSRGQHSALPHLRIPSCLFDTDTNTSKKNQSTQPYFHQNVYQDSTIEKRKKNKKGEGILSAESYVRYLKLYARRYGLESSMMLGYSVVKVCRISETLPSTSSLLQGPGTSNFNFDSDRSWIVDSTNESRTADSKENYLLPIESLNSKLNIDNNNHDDNNDNDNDNKNKNIKKNNFKWEVHYKQLYGDKKGRIFVSYCNSVVVACGKSQIPVTDENLLNTLKGFSGNIINAKNVKNVQALSEMGTVLLVGSGNSALDLCSALLKYRENKTIENENKIISNDMEIGSVVNKKEIESSKQMIFNKETDYDPINTNKDRNEKKIENKNKNDSEIISIKQKRNNNLVHMSMRSIPPCIPRQWGFLSVEEMSVSILQYLPITIADTVVWAFYHILSTGSSSYRNKIPGRKLNPDWYPFSSRRVPPIDKGRFALSVAEGKIILHSTICKAEGNELYFKNPHTQIIESNYSSSSSSSFHPSFHPTHGNNDLGSDSDFLHVDVVVLCTGYDPDWSWLHIPMPLTPLNSKFFDFNFNFPSMVHVSSSPSSAPIKYQIQESTTKLQEKRTHICSNTDRRTSQEMDRKILFTSLAKQRSAAPLLSLSDGLFFIGYDPGNALIPLAAIRNQAIDIAKYVNVRVRSSSLK